MTNTNELLAIETAFLSKSEIKAALQLTQIKGLQKNILNGQKKKFGQTLELSKLVAASVQWFKSEEGKAKFASEGISWTNEEFGNKVFGWQKSFFYKVIKAGNLKEETINTFVQKCDEIEATGKDANRTLENLLKYAKNEGANEGEEGTNEGEEGTNELIKPTTILTLTYKTEEGNICVRVDSNNIVKTTNSVLEIEAAIAFLRAQLPQ
jgi:hypothetical protein